MRRRQRAKVSYFGPSSKKSALTKSSNGSGKTRTPAYMWTPNHSAPLVVYNKLEISDVSYVCRQLEVPDIWYLCCLALMNDYFWLLWRLEYFAVSLLLWSLFSFVVLPIFLSWSFSKELCFWIVYRSTPFFVESLLLMRGFNFIGLLCAWCM